jgi:hypothetical protein
MNASDPRTATASSAVSVAREAAEAQFSRRLVTALTAHAAELPHDIQQRLTFGSQQALARLAQRRRVASAAAARSVSAGGSGAALALAGGSGSEPTGWWQRLGMVMPLLVLLGGLYGIDQWQLRESVLAAAEIDSLLLADDLPPLAYTDPGFTEFLRSSEE